MSLILDALRRADAERHAGQVPDLHAQPLPAVAHQPPPRARGSHWRWAIVGAAVGLALPLAWYLMGREVPQAIDLPATPRARPAAPATVDAPVAAPTAAPPALAPASPTVPPDSTSSIGPASSSGRAPTPAKSPGSAPIAEPAPWPQREARKAPTRPPPAPADGFAAQADAGRNPATSPPAAPIYDREQLPQEIRAALPALAIGGSIHSPNALDRTLIVNGRLYRENDVLAPDLSLEQIQQRSAVFRYRGYRFLMLF